jgi:hypothetical protein
VATTLTWKAYEAALSLVLDAELDSLANAGYTAASGAQGSDSTGGPLYADFELVLGSINPTDNLPLAELYLIRSADGTNYEDAPSSTNLGSGMYAGTFVGNYGTSAKRQILPQVQLPPGLWKAMIKNVSGVSFAASANELNVHPYNLLST